MKNYNFPEIITFLIKFYGSEEKALEEINSTESNLFFKITKHEFLHLLDGRDPAPYYKQVYFFKNKIISHYNYLKNKILDKN